MSDEDENELLYESLCISDGAGHMTLLELLEDKDANGAPERFTFTYRNDVTLEQVDWDSDGRLNGVTRYAYNQEGRLVESILRLRDGNEWLVEEHVTRTYVGHRAIVRRVDIDGLVLEQVFEGAQLVSESHSTGAPPLN